MGRWCACKRLFMPFTFCMWNTLYTEEQCTDCTVHSSVRMSWADLFSAVVVVVVIFVSSLMRKAGSLKRWSLRTTKLKPKVFVLFWFFMAAHLFWKLLLAWMLQQRKPNRMNWIVNKCVWVCEKVFSRVETDTYPSQQIEMIIHRI